jgi:hypothetical protein
MTGSDFLIIVRVLTELHLANPKKAENLCAELDPTGRLMAEVRASVDARVDHNRKRLAEKSA